MFTSISKAGVGLYVTLFVTTLGAFGFDLDEGTATEAVFLVVQGAGALLWIIGQIMRKDLRWGIFRNES